MNSSVLFKAEKWELKKHKPNYWLLEVKNQSIFNPQPTTFDLKIVIDHADDEYMQTFSFF